MVSETVFVLIVSYIPQINAALGTRELLFLHIGMPALPMSFLILLYDETRKYLIHSATENVKDDEKPGWFYRNCCY